MPDKFDFLSVDAFRKLSIDAKQRYLEQLKRYLDTLENPEGHPPKTDAKRRTGRTPT